MKQTGLASTLLSFQDVARGSVSAERRAVYHGDGEPVVRKAVPGLQHHALAGLAGTDLARRFCYWRGSSRRRYLFSVFPLDLPRADRCPRFEDAVVLVVAHGQDGEREILRVDESGCHPDAFFEDGQFAAAIAAGANEIHVHLLTEDAADRFAMMRDLRA